MKTEFGRVKENNNYPMSEFKLGFKKNEHLERFKFRNLETIGLGR